jgi:uncharacterized protein (TIRG00374 family)
MHLRFLFLTVDCLMAINSKRVVQTLLSVSILIVSVYFAFRGIDVDRFVAAFGQANYWWVLSTLPIVLLSHYVRAMRWKTLLVPIRREVSVISGFSAIMIGYMFNNLIPRSGEVIRAYVFSRRENFPLSTTFAVVFVERILDVVALAILLIFTSSAFSEEIAIAFPQFSSYVTSMMIVLALGVIAIVIFLKTSLGALFLRLVVQPFSEKWYQRLSAHLENFVKGFAVLSSPGQYLRIIAETLLMWLLYVLPLYILFFAFDFQSQLHLTMFDANVLCVITSLAIAVAPSPGAIGVYHYFAQITLTKFYGMNSETALAYATIAHGIGFLVPVLIGPLFMMRESAKGISWKSVSGSKAGESVS